MSKATNPDEPQQPTDYQRRFSQGRAQAQFSLQAVADAIGVSAQGVNRFEKGHSSMSLEKFLAACGAMKLRVEWVLYGTGKMFDGNPPAPNRERASGAGRPAGSQHVTND